MVLKKFFHVSLHSFALVLFSLSLSSSCHSTSFFETLPAYPQTSSPILPPKNDRKPSGLVAFYIESLSSNSQRNRRTRERRRRWFEYEPKTDTWTSEKCRVPQDRLLHRLSETKRDAFVIENGWLGRSGAGRRGEQLR